MHGEEAMQSWQSDLPKESIHQDDGDPNAEYYAHGGVERPKETRPEMLVAQGFDAQRDARELVQHLFYPGTSLDNIYVVWFCKTLQNWKAMVSTNIADDCYYEVTRNGSECETYVDRYIKEYNVKAQYHEDGKIDFEWNKAVH